MIKYREIGIEKLKMYEVFIWGCEYFGKMCTDYFKGYGIDISNYIDNDQNKWGTLFESKKVVSPKEVAQMDNDVTIVIAIRNFQPVLEQLQALGFTNILIYYCDTLYRCDNISILGVNTVSELKNNISNRKLVLFGEERYTKDFAYVFDWLDVEAVCESVDDIPDHKVETLLVLCVRNKDDFTGDLVNRGYIEDDNLVYAEDLFCMLDYLNDLNYYMSIPSIMMEKTWNDSMKEQKICTRAFRAVNVSSRFYVHCCCPDWSIPWGNIESDTLDAIWKSIIAKIFRLSLINRTYSFCNANRCVELKPIVPECYKRIEPSPRVPEIAKHLEIGIDKTCNLYCRSCRNEVYIEQRQDKIVNAKNRIVESGWLDKVDGLLLGGQGEVFFSNIYKEIMFGGEVKRKSIELRTNGVLITKEYLDKLIEKYEKIMIIVSIDAATKDTYNYVRRSNNPKSWDILQENLKLLSEYRTSGKLNFFQINMCVQMKNYSEIEAYVNMGMALGVDRVYITPIRNWGTYTLEEFETIGIFNDGKTLKEEVRRAIPDEVLANEKVLFAF